MTSISVKLEVDQIELGRATSAYDELRTAYEDGIRYALLSGGIGTSVAPVGQVLSARRR